MAAKSQEPIDLLMSITPVIGRRIMSGKKKYETPVDPWKIPGFLPPQSFRYVKAGLYGGGRVI
jgi:CRISPR/Cas system CMR-associated protein Cmr1 (group 7 of RAMP superfamily)